MCGAPLQLCPDGAVCEGLGALPYPKKGFWIDLSDPEYMDETKCCSGQYDSKGCIIDSNCKGGEHVFDRCFASEDAVSNCSTRKSIICRRGSGGKLCQVCAAFEINKIMFTFIGFLRRIAMKDGTWTEASAWSARALLQG